MNTRAPIVWVPNLGPHDYSPAKQYGELVFLTQGFVNRFDVGNIASQINNQMKIAQPQDYLMVTSLPILCSIASTILAQKFGQVNYLLYQGSAYVPKTVNYFSLVDVPQDHSLDSDHPHK